MSIMNNNNGKISCVCTLVNLCYLSLHQSQIARAPLIQRNVTATLGYSTPAARDYKALTECNQ